MTAHNIKRLFWISLLIKFLISALLPLTNDEAYYWVWSRHLQLSYYDHPPMVAWLYWLGDFTAWFPGSVRWPGIIMGHAGLAIWLLALRSYLTDDQRFYWLGLMLLSPLVGGSALVVTPDLPLLFFYGLALYVFLRWLKQPSALWAFALGLIMGLGFTSKYMMVLFPLGLIVALPREARTPALKGLIWVFLGGLVGTTPVWLWNVMHDFASIKFQAEHGLGRAWKPFWTTDYVLIQIALIFPPVLYSAWRARTKLPPFFHGLAWVPIVFFFATTFRGYVEANWPIAAYPAIFALAAAWLPGNRRALQFTLGLWGALIVFLASVIILKPTWSRGMKVKEFHQYDALVALVKEGAPQPLYTRSYQMAAKLHFELKRPISKLRGMTRRDFYDFLDESEPTAHVYYVLAEKGDRLPPALKAKGHSVTEKTELEPPFELWKVESP